MFATLSATVCLPISPPDGACSAPLPPSSLRLSLPLSRSLSLPPSVCSHSPHLRRAAAVWCTETSSRTLFPPHPSGRVWPPSNMYPAGRRGRCPGGSGVAPRTPLPTVRTGQVRVASWWILLAATCVIGARAQGKTRGGGFDGAGGGTGALPPEEETALSRTG